MCQEIGVNVSITPMPLYIALQSFSSNNRFSDENYFEFFIPFYITF